MSLREWQMIRLRTLGTLDLRSDGTELLTVLAQPKRLALLVYLALAAPRGAHRRDTLLALFWPEHDADHARNALSQAVHFLRRAMGPDALVSRGADDLTLAADHVWCDAIAFEAALEEHRLDEAVELYRGDLLEGFHVADAGPEFERWLDAERARLAGKYETAVEQLAGTREAAGDFTGAVAWWRRLSARDPHNSRVTLRLMRALVAKGDPAGALKQARVHETLLSEELGVAPDAEVGALVRELQAAPARQPSAAKASAVIPVQPPPPTAVPHAPVSRRRWLAAALAAAGLGLLLAGLGAVVLRNGGRAAAASIRSLAVLPLETLAGDSTQRAFADGMHDALITELARYPDLSVISRTSVLRYRGEVRTALPEIARELKVDGIVEGTLLWEGGRFRMTAQLVHGPSDRHLWADSYRRDLRDVLTLQAELAQAIAREVRVVTAPAQRRPFVVAGPAHSAPEELYLRELYVRGRQAELSRSLAGIQTAREAYRRAIERDSTFALSYAGLAAVYGYMGDYNYAPVHAALDTARLMARRAVELDSTLPDTRAALAVTLADAHQFEAAEHEFRRAIELGPSDARARYGYSFLLVALGRGEQALEEARRAKELDPFAPRGLAALEYWATWLLTGEWPNLRLPVRERRPILSLEPEEPWARARLAVDLAQEGRCQEARAEIQRAQQGVQPANIRILQNLGEVYWRCGERDRARTLLEQMKRRPDARDHGLRIAWLHMVFGEQDAAFAWLEHNRWTLGQLANLSAGWELDPLRSDPRYLELMRRLGIRPRQAPPGSPASVPQN